MTAKNLFGYEDRLSRLSVWAVEPCHSGSRQDFLDGFAGHSSHRITPLTLSGGNWEWRGPGGAIALAERARSLLGGAEPNAAPPPDVILVSDMLDLPAFLAVTGPGLAQLPVIVYFRDLDSSMMNIASALAARSVLFSSAFHRGEFFATVRELLASLPDAALAWAVRELEGKSRVLPPGCDLRRLDLDRQRGLADAASGRWGDPGLGPLVVWNPTWEDDESPREVFAVLMDLKAEGVPFRLAVAGGNDSAPPAESSRAREELGDRVVQWEPVPDRQEYASLLWAADVVVSAARHDYSGAGVVEALYCGCRPVLPHRLSYPEIIPTDAHERVLYREGELASALRSALARPREWSEDWQRTWVARYDWASMAARYDEEIRRCWKTAREEW